MSISAKTYINNFIDGLIAQVRNLQENADIGIFSTTGVSSISVVATLLSPGYSQISMLHNLFSSAFINRTEDDPLFNQILAINGYSTLSQYNEQYLINIDLISSYQSTANGIKRINDISGATVLPILYWQQQVAESKYNTALAIHRAYSTHQAELSTYYISTLNAYSTASSNYWAAYIAASTLENISTSTIASVYKDIMNAQWIFQEDIFGKLWINTEMGQQIGGGIDSQNLRNILIAYSSMQLSDTVLYNRNKLEYMSSMISRLDDNISENTNTLNTYITCDYSTVVSTYFSDSLKHKDEILSCTRGELHLKFSSLYGYSTLWISAMNADQMASTNYSYSISTYNGDINFMQNISANYANISSIYRSSLQSFKFWEQHLSTANDVVKFLRLQQEEINATSLFNSTSMLKNQIEDIINFLSQGVNVDSYLTSLRSIFTGIQTGGASMQDIQIMYSTIQILYSTHNARAISATEERVNANLLASIEEIYSAEYSRILDATNQDIIIAEDNYNANVLSTFYLNRQISSQQMYLSTYIATSSINALQISSLYSSKYSLYQSMIEQLLMEYGSTQQLLYKYRDLAFRSTILMDTALNRIKQISMHLEELGYTISYQQTGGEVFETDPIIVDIPRISYLIDYQKPSLIKNIIEEVCSLKNNMYHIQSSINFLKDEQTNKAIPLKKDAITTLMTDLETYIAKSQISYDINYEVSNYRYTNYLTTLYGFSTLLTTNLLENRDEITNLEYIKAGYNPFPVTRVSTHNTVNITYQVSTLSSYSNNIRNYRKSLQSFINYTKSGKFSMDYYLSIKNNFETQEYFRLQQGVVNPNRMSSYDFEQLKNAYDISIQNINRHIAYRSTNYSIFVERTENIKASLRDSILESLKNDINPILAGPMYSITSSLQMDFITVPSRFIFPSNGLPTTTLLDCQNTAPIISDFEVTTLAGSGDYTWNRPTNVAVDSNGNVIVADRGNNRIYKVTSDGVVTTLAGSGTAAFADGVGAGASFNYPHSVAVDSNNNIIVADTSNNRIRKISLPTGKTSWNDVMITAGDSNSGGVVTTLAGSRSGFADGVGAGASFNQPNGVAVDSSGNVIVADTHNHRIRKVTPGGVVTTLAGSGSGAFADGVGAGASFKYPTGVAVDSNNNIIVADTHNHRIRKISLPTGKTSWNDVMITAGDSNSGGVVTTLAGSGSGGFADGVGAGASFYAPYSVAVDSNNNIIVADTINNRIRRVTPGGVVTTLAGNATGGFADGIGARASFDTPTGVAVDSSDNVIVADLYNHRIRKATLLLPTATLATPTYPVQPTTTTNTVTHGIQGRYIHISKADGNFNILQICVIDSRGKNVAFEKSVNVINAPAIQGLSAIVENAQSSFRYTVPPSLISLKIQIDLATVYDITSIKYTKAEGSQYDSRGLTFDIINTQNVAIASRQLTANTATEYIDFRTDPNATMFINPSRTGACGYFGRYLRISRETMGNLKISQIAVVSLGGVNVALNSPATYYSNGSVQNTTTILTNGMYYARPEGSSGVYTIRDVADYIQIDLGSEVEVVAVHVYALSGNEGTTASLYTDDNFLAYTQRLTSNNVKGVFDFRNTNSTSVTHCSTKLLWPPYYSVAGTICRYVRLSKGTGQLGFTKVKIVDKTGKDVALFKNVVVSSEAFPNSRYYGVSDYLGPQPSSLSYCSALNDLTPSYHIDLEKTYEICSVTVYRCSNGVPLSDNMCIEFFGNNPNILLYSTFTGQGVTGSTEAIFYDMRYDPNDEGSNYPIDIISSIYTYGRFGTLAKSVEVPANTASLQITEGTGQNLFEEATVTETSIIKIITFENLREVNSVIIPGAPIGTRITLRDCDGNIINNKGVYNFSTATAVYRLADFRNPGISLLSSYAPMTPLMLTPLSNDMSSLYDYTNGVSTKYVKVTPPPGGKLYISQILVIDSRGINVAFEKDTFTTDLANITNTAKAVDGEYEQSLNSAIPSMLSYDNYVCKSETKSFITKTVDKYWIVDLGKEYSVNSIIFVAAEGRSKDSHNVIIELFNAQLNRVGVNLVSKYVSIFGVDILDFRRSRTRSALNDGGYLEVRPRKITAGCTGCGIMTQYVRLEGVNIKLSQIIVMDPNGVNIALFMPTYSPINRAYSYKVTDGKYYRKLEETPSGVETEAFIVYSLESTYVEVNFGTEYEVVKVFLIPTLETPIITGLKIKLYNQYRDVIALLDPSIQNSDYSNVPISLTGVNNIIFPSATNIIGVSILRKYSEFLTQAGQMSENVATGATGDTIIPLGFSCPPGQLSPATTSCTNVPLFTVPRFNPGPNGGIPCRYIRVFNVSQYVQISQIMAYGADGTNYAYQKGAQSESIFPGTYPAKVTDGLGGYFHNARTWADSYRSSGKRYDFIEIDLTGSASAQSPEIVGIRCIFSSNNQEQNVGTRIILFNENRVSLAQYVVGNIINPYNSGKYEFQETLIDYRIQPVSVPINKIIMPKIFSLGSRIGTPNGIVEIGTELYVADTLGNKIVKNGGVWSSDSSISYPAGLANDMTALYVASYGRNKILKIPITGSPTVTQLCAVINPYGLCTNGNILYVTAYQASPSSYYTVEITTGNILSTVSLPNVNFPNSIVHLTMPDQLTPFLLICSANDKCVYKVEIGATPTKYIATPGTTAAIQINMIAPSAMTYDSNSYTLFISDYVQCTVYYVKLITGETGVLAGNGIGGYGGDGGQGVLANLDGPMNITYSAISGNLYISDYNNKVVRYLQLYSQPAMGIASTTTSPNWVDSDDASWTTTTLSAAGVTTTPLDTPQYNLGPAYPLTLSHIVTPDKISLERGVPGITAFYVSNNIIYHAVGGNLYSNNIHVGTISGNITCITINRGVFYVYDSVNKCIWNQTETSTTTETSFTRYIGDLATYPFTFQTPVCIAFDNNNRLYISDSGLKKIIRLSNRNTLETYVGGENAVYSTNMYSSAFALSEPRGFVFDSRNNLILIDGETVYKVLSANGMIQPICNYTGGLTTYVDQIIRESVLPLPSAFPYKIRRPYGITIDNADTLYITSSGGQQILKLTPALYDINSSTYHLDIVAGFGSVVKGLEIPTRFDVPVGSVGRMDGWWIGGTGDITHVVLDDANNNIVFLGGGGSDGNIGVIDLKGKAAYYGGGYGFNSFNLTKWYANDSMFIYVGRNFIYKPIDSGIFMTGGVKVIGSVGHDATRLWFLAINNGITQYVAYNLVSNATESSYYSNTNTLRTAFNNMIQASYTVPVNSYTTYYNTVKNTVMATYADSVDSLAKYASLNAPSHIYYQSSGIYFLDGATFNIRKITPAVTSSVPYTDIVPYGNMNIVANYSKEVFNDMVKNDYVNTNRATAVAIDSSGNIYVANTNDHTILMVTPLGVISVLAGNGTAGWADGTGAAAKFNEPQGLALGINETILYVADTANNRIRAITISTSVTTTLAGNGTAGWADDTGAAAKFNTPTGVAVSPNGTILYVADTANNRIRAITISTGVTTTLAGNGTAGWADNTGTAAKFNTPTGVAVSPNGTILYVADTANNRIRAITISTGTTTTLAGAEAGYFRDGIGTAALFKSPRGIVVASNGTLYVADAENNRIRQITSEGVTITLAGNGNPGFKDSTGENAIFNTPGGLAIHPLGSIYVADTGNKNIRIVNVGGVVTTLPEYNIGFNALAGKFRATSICVDSANNLYFPNSLTGKICKISSNGNFTVLSATLNTVGMVIYKDTTLYITNGTQINSMSIADQKLGTPITHPGCSCIAVSPVGYMYVSALTDITVYNLKTGNLVVKTLHISRTHVYVVSSIDCLCVDLDCNLYVGITGGTEFRIFKYDSEGNLQAATASLGSKVTGLAFSKGSLYYLRNYSIYQTNGTATGISDIFNSTLATGIPVIGKGIQGQVCDAAYGNTTTLNAPVAITIDINGAMYIVDTAVKSPTTLALQTTSIIIKSTSYIRLQSGLLYNIAGTNAPGNIIPNLSAHLANFSSIQGVCYDSVGNMYVADSALNTVSKIDLTGKLTTFAGEINTVGSYTGDGEVAATARLRGPTDIKMSKSDVLYIADTGNNAIRRVKLVGGSNYKIETFISNVTSPTALAIDYYENIYVVTGASNISVISPLTGVLTNVVNAGFNVNALAVNTMNELFYTGNACINRVNGTPISGFIEPTGIVIDEDNTIYVSDVVANKVFSILGGTNTAIIGNGLQETPVSITEGLAENIYGNGAPPLFRAFSAPGALSIKPSSGGLLVAQPTKLSLLSRTTTNLICGTQANSFTIRNGGEFPIFLSQVVALDTTGTNVLLKSDAQSYFDGFYGCKSNEKAYRIERNNALEITLPTNITITCILLYFGVSYKTGWNDATLEFGNSYTRYIEGVTDTPESQYALFDYRTRTHACIPFINYVNKYKLQTTASHTTETYRVQYARYIRIKSLTTQMTVQNIYAIHGETGKDLLFKKVPYLNADIKRICQPYDITNIANATTTRVLQNFPSSNQHHITNFWIEYDLGDEYPVEQIIIKQLGLGVSGKYSVSLYTSNRAEISFPNLLDSQIHTIQMDSGLTISPHVTVEEIQNRSEFIITEFTALTTTTAAPTTPTGLVSHKMLRLKNLAEQEIDRVGITYNQYKYTPPSPSLYLAYSFTPIVGTQRVRYILLSGQIQLSQIIVFDSNGINVSYGKTATSSVGNSNVNLPMSGRDEAAFSASLNSWWELDLGQEHDLIQIVCINKTSTANTATIELRNAFREQQGSTLNLTGTAQYTSFDLRSTVKSVVLPVSDLNSAWNMYTPDGSLQRIVRGRYVRIENASPGSPFFPTVTGIYDIYGKNLMVARVVSHSSPSTNYGSWWEVDLGQEYSIKHILYAGRTVAAAIYNRMRAEIWRNFISGSLTAPFPLQIDPAKTAGTAMRFIRLVGTCTINHVAAIDVNGIDMAVWKPARVLQLRAPAAAARAGRQAAVAALEEAAAAAAEAAAAAAAAKARMFAAVAEAVLTTFSWAVLAAAARPHCLAVGDAAMKVSENALTASVQASNAASVATQIGFTELATAATSAATAAMTASETTHAAGFLAQNNLNYSVEQMQLKVETAISAINAALTAVITAKRSVEAVTLHDGYTESYNTFNGSYASAISITLTGNNRLEIDLGRNISISSIKIYLSSGTATCTAFKSNGNPVTLAQGFFTTDNTIPTTLQNYTLAGFKTRYVGITTAAPNAKVNNIVVLDTQGRNIIPNSAKDTSGNPVYGFINTFSSDISLPTLYTQLDLGEEHSILSVIVYYNMEAIGGLNTITLKLMDAYYNTVVSAVSPAKSSNLGNYGKINYNLGQPWNNTDNLLITSSENTVIMNIQDSDTWSLLDIATDSFGNIYVLFKIDTNDWFTSSLRKINRDGTYVDYTLSSLYGNFFRVSYDSIVIQGDSMYLFGRAIKTAEDLTKFSLSSIFYVACKLSIPISSAGLQGTLSTLISNNRYAGSYNFIPHKEGDTIPSICKIIRPIIDNRGYVYFISRRGDAANSQEPYLTDSRKLYQYNLTYNTKTEISNNFLGNVIAFDKDDNLYYTKIVINNECSHENTIFKREKLNNGDGFKDEETFVSFVSAIVGMAFDSNNILYVADTYSKRIRVVTPTGNVETIIETGDISLLGSLIVDSSKNIYYITGKQCKKLRITSSYNLPFLAPVEDNVGYVDMPPACTNTAEIFDFSLPSEPAYTIGNITNTTFQITKISADNATGFQYSLNGGAAAALAQPVTITSAAQSYNTLVLYSVNSIGKSQVNTYVQLAPPAPAITLGTTTPTGFSITYTPVLSPGSGSTYNTEYRYMVNGYNTKPTSISGTNPITATFIVYTAGNAPSINIFAYYKRGGDTVFSTSSNTLQVQLDPPAPIPTLVADSTTDTGFQISWAPVTGPSLSEYTLSYLCKINGTAAPSGQVSIDTTVTPHKATFTGQAASTNMNVSVVAQYVATGLPTLQTESTSLNVQIVPNAPVITADAYPEIDDTSIIGISFYINFGSSQNKVNIYANYNVFYQYYLTYSDSTPAYTSVQYNLQQQNNYLNISNISANLFVNVQVRSILQSKIGTITVRTPYSETLSFQLNPPAPTGLAITGTTTTTGFSISWTAVNPPTGSPTTTAYQYRINGTLISSGVTTTSTGSTITATFTGQPVGAYLSVSVAAAFTYNGRTMISAQTAIKVQLAPGAPTLSLTAGSTTTTNFSMQWSSVSVPAGSPYSAAYKWTLSNGLTGTTPLTSAVFTWLPFNTTVTATVQATYYLGTRMLLSAISNTLSVSLTPLTTSWVTLLDVPTSTSFTVQFYTISSYNIFEYSYSTSGGTSYITIPIYTYNPTTKMGTATVTGQTAGSTINFIFRFRYSSIGSFNWAGQGAAVFSAFTYDAFNITLGSAAPTVSLVSRTSTSFVVSLPTPTATISYTFKIGEQTLIPTASTGATGQTNYTFLHILPVGSYVILLTSQNALNGSGIITTTSDPTSLAIQLLPPAPTNLRLHGQQSQAFQILWTAVSVPPAGSSYTVSYTWTITNEAAETQTATTIKENPTFASIIPTFMFNSPITATVKTIYTQYFSIPPIELSSISSVSANVLIGTIGIYNYKCYISAVNPNDVWALMRVDQITGYNNNKIYNPGEIVIYNNSIYAMIERVGARGYIPSTRYWIQLSIGATVISAESASLQVQNFPPVPTNLAITGTPLATEFSASWTAIPEPGISGYTTSYAWTLMPGNITGTVTENTVKITGLIASKFYTLSLVAIYDNTSSSLTSDIATIIIQLAPVAPTGLAHIPSSLTSTEFNVSWDAEFLLYPLKILASISDHPDYVTTGTIGIYNDNYYISAVNPNHVWALMRVDQITGYNNNRIYNPGEIVIYNNSIYAMIERVGARGYIPSTQYWIQLAGIPYTVSYTYVLGEGTPVTTTSTTATFTGLTGGTTQKVTVCTVFTAGSYVITSSPSIIFVTLPRINPPLAPTDLALFGTPTLRTFTVSWNKVADPPDPYFTEYVFQANGNTIQEDSIRPFTAEFQGRISGTTLTVTSIISGAISIGMVIDTETGGAITAQVTAELEGTTGGTGQYTVALSQTVDGTTITAETTIGKATFTAGASSYISAFSMYANYIHKNKTTGIIDVIVSSNSSSPISVHLAPPPPSFLALLGTPTDSQFSVVWNSVIDPVRESGYSLSYEFKRDGQSINSISLNYIGNSGPIQLSSVSSVSANVLIGTIGIYNDNYYISALNPNRVWASLTNPYTVYNNYTVYNVGNVVKYNNFVYAMKESVRKEGYNPINSPNLWAIIGVFSDQTSWDMLPSGAHYEATFKINANIFIENFNVYAKYTAGASVVISTPSNPISIHPPPPSPSISTKLLTHEGFSLEWNTIPIPVGSPYTLSYNFSYLEPRDKLEATLFPSIDPHVTRWNFTVENLLNGGSILELKITAIYRYGSSNISTESNSLTVTIPPSPIILTNSNDNLSYITTKFELGNYPELGIFRCWKWVKYLFGNFNVSDGGSPTSYDYTSPFVDGVKSINTYNHTMTPKGLKIEFTEDVEKNWSIYLNTAKYSDEVYNGTDSSGNQQIYWNYYKKTVRINAKNATNTVSRDIDFCYPPKYAYMIILGPGVGVNPISNINGESVCTLLKIYTVECKFGYNYRLLAGNTYGSNTHKTLKQLIESSVITDSNNVQWKYVGAITTKKNPSNGNWFGNNTTIFSIDNDIPNVNIPSNVAKRECTIELTNVQISNENTNAPSVRASVTLTNIILCQERWEGGTSNPLSYTYSNIMLGNLYNINNRALFVNF